MRVALIGSNGFIAKQLSSLLNAEIIKMNRRPEGEEVYFDCSMLDDMDFTKFSGIDYALFLIADSSIERCENDIERTEKLNVVYTLESVKKISEQGCKVIFFSSDAVYGSKGGYLYEDDTCDPISNYGKMKLYVENKVKDNDNISVIRLPYVFSWYDKFTSYFRECVNNGITAEVYDSFSRDVISIKDLAEIINWKFVNWDKYPLINASGGVLISRVDIAEALNLVLKKTNTFKTVAMSESFKRFRPSVTDMKSHYVQSILVDYGKASFVEKVKEEYYRVNKMEELK